MSGVGTWVYELQAENSVVLKGLSSASTPDALEPYTQHPNAPKHLKDRLPKT